MEPGLSGRESLRSTFESAAAAYHRARPRYPVELFDAVAAYAGDGATRLEVLEIGPATGIATVPLAERGWSVTGVELGDGLAERCRANTAGFEAVSIVTASFDEWEPAGWHAFDVVAAATSWHWLDPTTRYERAHRHLRPGGTLAVWSAQHVVPVDGDGFFAEIQDVYDEIGESRGDEPWVRPGEVATFEREMLATGLFAAVEVHQFDWEVEYDSEGYIDLLDTFSGHIAMEPRGRAHLDAAIRRRLAERPDGRLRRHWGVALHLARAI